MLSLMRMGMPCRGPRTLPPLRSASSASASAMAVALISMTAFNIGPESSICLMRSRYACVRARDVSVPAAMRSRASTALSSTTSRVGGDDSLCAAGDGGGVWPEHAMRTQTRMNAGTDRIGRTAQALCAFDALSKWLRLHHRVNRSDTSTPLRGPRNTGATESHAWTPPDWHRSRAALQSAHRRRRRYPRRFRCRRAPRRQRRRRLRLLQRPRRPCPTAAKPPPTAMPINAPFFSESEPRLAIAFTSTF